MDMMYQLMDRMLASAGMQQAPSPQLRQKEQPQEDKSFGSMVRQKRQEAPKNQPEKAAREKEQPKETEAPQNDADGKVFRETVTNEEYTLALGMMYQGQPEVQLVIVQEEQAAETAPVAQVQELLPETAEAPEVLVETEAPEVPVQDLAPEQQIQEKPETFEAVLTEERPELVERDDGTVRQAVEEAPVQLEEEKLPEEAEIPQTALFENVQAAPVKVAAAEAEKPLPLEQPEAAEKLAERLEGAIVNTVTENKVEITLEPASLGRITVQLVRNEDGMLHVLLHTTTEKAAALLQKHSGGLQQLLMSDARSEVHVEVRGTEHSDRQYLDPNGSNQQQQHQQQQQQQERRQQPHQAQEFLQQLRLGLVDLAEVSR